MDSAVDTLTGTSFHTARHARSIAAAFSRPRIFPIAFTFFSVPTLVPKASQAAAPACVLSDEQHRSGGFTAVPMLHRHLFSKHPVDLKALPQIASTARHTLVSPAALFPSSDSTTTGFDQLRNPAICFTLPVHRSGFSHTLAVDTNSVLSSSLPPDISLTRPWASLGSCLSHLCRLIVLQVL